MRAVFLSTTLLTSVLAPMAMAQDGGVVTLAPILVYGDRSADTLDESRSSLSVVDAHALDAPVNTTVTDAFRRVAGVSDGDFTESGFVLRGINSEGMTPGGAGAPLAAIYIDGIQQTAEASRRGPSGVFDAEQLEIYRGPQSTLTGRNALAGAIYLRTKDPEFSRSGKIALTYGEDNRRQLGIAFGNALSETLAFRVSGEWSQKDSLLNFPDYAEFPHADDLATDSRWSLRSKLLWEPSDATSVLLSYARSYESPASSTIAGPNRVAPGVGVSYDDLRGDIYGQTLTPGFYALLNPTITQLPVFQDVRETTVDNAGIEVTHDFGGGVTLTSLTTLSRSETDRRSVNEGLAAFPIIGFIPPADITYDPRGFYAKGGFDQRLFSQEFRLNGATDRMSWVGGLYYAKERNTGELEALRPDPNFANPAATLPLAKINTRNEAEIENIALFGEVAYEFAPGWDVILGGRVDRYTQSQTATSTVVDQLLGPISDVSFASEYEATTFIPKVGISTEIGTDGVLALTYREGYRPGGSGIRQDLGQAYDYEAEKARNLELSYKGNLADGRLNLGASLFYQKWDNQQIELWQVAGNPASSQIVNAGKSTSYGAELELSYVATDMVEVYGGVALLKTEFDDFQVGGLDFSGQAFSNAPDKSIVLGVSYGGDIGWFGGANVKYTSESLSRIEGGVPVREELSGYTTVDVHAGYAWEAMSLTAYATNLFDQRYTTYENGQGSTSAADSLAVVGAPREIGITLSRNF